ncbi:hypothetical protein [Pigmentiphaga litoralis]|uniref:hypothetical protein n=1 Tax=Pigmentiphaga litoralis TaxID=516702 RepID=UPI003B427A00
MTKTLKLICVTTAMAASLTAGGAFAQSNPPAGADAKGRTPPVVSPQQAETGGTRDPAAANTNRSTATPSGNVAGVGQGATGQRGTTQLDTRKGQEKVTRDAK